MALADWRRAMAHVRKLQEAGERITLQRFISEAATEKVRREQNQR